MSISSLLLDSTINGLGVDGVGVVAVDALPVGSRVVQNPRNGADSHLYAVGRLSGGCNARHDVAERDPNDYRKWFAEGVS